MEMLDGFLPFIETQQYADFVLACDYVQNKRKIGLVYGVAGAGKSWAAIQYVRSQERMIANGRYPIHYMHLSQGEKTDRSFLNALIESITGEPRRNIQSGVAMAEAIRLWNKFGYQMLIVDEVLALQPTGIEAIRTFHDRGPHYPRIPVVLITVPYIKTRLEHPRYEAFYSRIGRVQNFDSLSKDQLHNLLLHLPSSSFLKYTADQKDAEEILKTLYTGAGGATKAKARFRVVDDILSYCDVLLKIKYVERKRFIQENPKKKALAEPQFDVALIKEAIIAVQQGREKGEEREEEDAE